MPSLKGVGSVDVKRFAQVFRELKRYAGDVHGVRVAEAGMGDVTLSVFNGVEYVSVQAQGFAALGGHEVSVSLAECREVLAAGQGEVCFYSDRVEVVPQFGAKTVVRLCADDRPLSPVFSLAHRGRVADLVGGALGQVRLVAKAAPENGATDAHLAFVGFEAQGGHTRAWATDRYRAAMSDAMLGGEVSARVPIGLLRHVLRLAGKSDVQVDLVSGGRVRLFTRAPNGLRWGFVAPQVESQVTFEMIRKLFPKEFPLRVEVDRNGLAEFCEALPGYEFVSISSDAGRAVAKSVAVSSGSKRVVLSPGAGCTPNVEVTFKAKFLLDAISGSKTEMVVLDGTHPTKPWQVWESGVQWLVVPTRTVAAAPEPTAAQQRAKFAVAMADGRVHASQRPAPVDAVEPAVKPTGKEVVVRRDLPNFDEVHACADVDYEPGGPAGVVGEAERIVSDADEDSRVCRAIEALDDPDARFVTRWFWATAMSDAECGLAVALMDAARSGQTSWAVLADKIRGQVAV